MMKTIWKAGDRVLSPEGIPGVVIAVDGECVTVDFGGPLGRYPSGAGLRPIPPRATPTPTEEE